MRRLWRREWRAGWGAAGGSAAVRERLRERTGGDSGLPGAEVELVRRSAAPKLCEPRWGLGRDVGSCGSRACRDLRVFIFIHIF